MRRTRLVAMAGVVAALLMAPATAQALSFVVDPSHVVVPGGSVDFQATLTLEPGDPDPLDLLGIAVNLSDPALTVDDAPFFNTWPLQLDSTTPSFSGLLFTVFADLTAVPPGPYTGSVTLLVGNGTATFDIVQPFEVTVEGTQPPVPEPATLALLAFGLAGLATRRRTAR